LEASALTHVGRRGLIPKPQRPLRLTGDERLIAMMRDGQERAFEVLFERYQTRLLAFCQHMLSSREDAEDVLQEVFVAAHKAILADNRALNVRPWLYRIARNRCLNHLRKPVPEGQDSMDFHPYENGASTAERVQNREEFRQLISDVQTLPETQRTALLLREVDAMSYEEIAHSMENTVPSVKSLLVRARITLAEASQARQLTCGEVQLELAEGAEGLRKVSGPVRQHVRGCDGCADFRKRLRSDSRALAALMPIGPLLAVKQLFGAKLAGLFGGGSSAGGSAAGGAMATGTAAGGAAGGAAAGAAALSGAAGGAGGIGGMIAGGIGAKAAAGVATAALLTAGAVEVKSKYSSEPDSKRNVAPAAVHGGSAADVKKLSGTVEHTTPTPAQEPTPAPAPEPVEVTPPVVSDPAPAATEPAGSENPPAGESATDEAVAETPGAIGTVVTETPVAPPPPAFDDPAKIEHPVVQP
jgi:RNA polymerase sigma factor (sigma-70 family)